MLKQTKKCSRHCIINATAYFQYLQDVFPLLKHHDAHAGTCLTWLIWRSQKLHRPTEFTNALIIFNHHSVLTACYLMYLEIIFVAHQHSAAKHHIVIGHASVSKCKESRKSSNACWISTNTDVIEGGSSNVLQPISEAVDYYVNTPANLH